MMKARLTGATAEKCAVRAASEQFGGRFVTKTEGVLRLDGMMNGCSSRLDFQWE